MLGEVDSTVKVYGVRFLVNLECLQCSSLPEAMSCPVDTNSLLVNAEVSDVNMHCSPIFLVTLSYSLFVLGHSYLHGSLCLDNVHLVAVLSGDWYTSVPSSLLGSVSPLQTAVSGCF